MNQILSLPGRVYRKYRRFKEVRAEFLRFRTLANASPKNAARFELEWSDRYLCLSDATGTTGFDRHYIFHPAWAARIIAETRPPEHIDISSTLHFSSQLSAFVPVRFYDYRPARMELSGLTTDVADLTRLPFASGSIGSLSCMHVLEHVGLGRYGDPLDPSGDLKAMKELERVLAPGGNLLVVVPIGGKARIQFNAHRIYRYEQVIEAFPELKVVEFALIPDDAKDGDLVRHASPELASQQRYGCGCFWFERT
jgi:SAM-dependent methyltransferase